MFIIPKGQVHLHSCQVNTQNEHLRHKYVIQKVFNLQCSATLQLLFLVFHRQSALN